MRSNGAGEGVQIILPKLLINKHSYGSIDPLIETGKLNKSFTEMPSLKLSITWSKFAVVRSACSPQLKFKISNDGRGSSI
jgi:hypothetical protein